MDRIHFSYSKRKVENYGLTQLVDKSACTYERYKLTNVVNGKYYFGQTIDLKTRLVLVS